MLTHRRYGGLPDDHVATHLVKRHNLDASVAYYTDPAKLHAHHYVEHKMRTTDHEHPMNGGQDEF